MHRRALAIQLKVLGEDHPDTAASYNNLAVTLRAQGKYAEAEAMHRHALAILLKALGEDHPDTATSYNNLAWSLDRQGKHDDALRTWTAAAASYEQARLRGAKGLDAALTAGKSPLPSFALALARAGQPRDAWTRWEQGLARGLIDEVTGRAARPLTAAEHDREARLLGQAQALDERIGKLLALKALSQEQDKLLEDLKRQASELRRQVLELEQQFESQVRRPRRPARHARSRPEGSPRRDGPGWLDRSGSLPLGLPAAALRRPRLGPAPRLRQGRRLDQGGGRAGATPPRRAQPGNHQRQRPPAGRGAGAAAARTAEGASQGGQPAGRREFAGTGGRAHRGADGGAAGPGLGRHHRRVCPLGLDVRVPRGQADAARPRPHAAGPGRSGLSRDRRKTPPRPRRRMRGSPSPASSPTATPTSTASERGMSC